MQDIRPSPIAGQWYPDTPAVLRRTLDSYLGDPIAPIYDHLTGILVPHAGLRFSGPVAARSFRHLYGRQVEVVVIVAPSHYPYPYPLLTSGHSAFQTPLGTVPVAQDIIKAVSEQVAIHPVRNDPEHAIEIELPFLQHILGEFSLVPLAIIDQRIEAAQQLATALSEVLAGHKVLFVASSDLSHFYDDTLARHLDQQVLAAVAAYQPNRVIELEDEGRGFACGRGAIATVMLAAQQMGATTATIEHYDHSGAVTRDLTRVVGYGAATFHH